MVDFLLKRARGLAWLEHSTDKSNTPKSLFNGGEIYGELCSLFGVLGS